ncbi:CoA ester lyase [Rhodococcus sp. KRD162]|uniref:HpcH/HpaI aldolase/citrate lyase family protein n=1 Tax=Rhodococcus sp. KRD162 TaxID=2729725 RepID=UPI0019D08716|nr:CoA ester lyase [Rhodococcus sp. KRD162]
MNWVPPGPAWLFCPADRPERYEKAAARADVVILDLEDAVGAADKAAARESVIATRLDPSRTIVRVNAHGTDDQVADLEALEQTEYTTVMLPKCESAEQITALVRWNVVALIESPLGAMTVFEALAADNAIGAMWGAEDLVAAMGGNSSRHAGGEYRAVAQHVRSQTLLAAKARGLFALDSVFLDIPDLDGVRTEAEDAVAVGFDGKVSIHPSHIPVIRDAYAPSGEDLEWATAVLDAVAHNRGVFTFRGQMVDAPVLAHARRIVARRPA